MESNSEAVKQSKIAAEMFYPKHLIDGIDARDVVDVEKKVNRTIHRLARLQNWQAKDELGWVKKRAVAMVKNQLDFLLRVEEVKEDFTMRHTESANQWELTIDAINRGEI